MVLKVLKNSKEYFYIIFKFSDMKGVGLKIGIVYFNDFRKYSDVNYS